MRILADRFVLADAEPRKGGMAEVCRAADHQDNLKPVAIKFMKGSRIHDDRILREAFSRELSALHALDHPNIVKIIDFDPRHDPPYMVLEWLDRDLSAYLETTALQQLGRFLRQDRPPRSQRPFVCANQASRASRPQAGQYPHRRPRHAEGRRLRNLQVLRCRARRIHSSVFQVRAVRSVRRAVPPTSPATPTRSRRLRYGASLRANSLRTRRSRPRSETSRVRPRFTRCCAAR